MILFADYEGLGVAFAQILWLLGTIPAALMALGGVAAGAWKPPRRTLAIWLGAAACLVEVAGITVVCLAFTEARTLHGAFAERFRPGPAVWIVSALTIMAGVWAVYLGIARKQPQTS